jgi:PAS domain S-box-containing protein
MPTGEGKYQQLFEALNEGAALLEVVSDAEGRPVDYLFVEVNSAYEEVVGASRKSRVGHRLSEFSAPNGPCFELLGKVAGTGQAARAEMYIEEIKKHVRVSAFRSDLGRVTAVLSDVTDRRLAQDELQIARDSLALNVSAEWAQKLRESEARFRTTVDNIPINLVLYDRDLRLLYLNPALKLLCSVNLKLPPEDLLGKRGEKLWPEAVWAPIRQHAARAIETGERQTYELATDIPGRPPFVRQWTVVPLPGSDGEVAQILVMSQDITAQRRLVDQLREADRRKSEFIAVLSHELRNPLAAIRAALYVLEHGGANHQSVGNARTVIDRQVGHVVRMVDDLLDVTRISRNKIELQRRPLDLNQVVCETIEDNRSHLEFGGVRLEVRVSNTPLQVNADGARISQVITNLLSNAIKFSPAGGAVTIAVTADPQNERAVLTVTDTGIGMEPVLMERLFQPFMQGDDTLDRNSGGLGLGLALVKGLVELHGGEVSVRSAGLNQGSEFIVRLPIEGGMSRRGEIASDLRIPQLGRRVLIIDDDRDVADGLRAVLEIHKHQVEVAGNGRDALEAARLFRPDIVFCDIGLPGMNGYEVARAFRADGAFRSIRLVALSGYAQAEDLAKARAAGFDQHLAKPPNMEKIRRICSTVGGEP